MTLPLTAQRFLAVFEGLEGGFAIGASVIVALSFGGFDRDVLLMIVVITLLVGGFNSAAVKYSSEHFLDELDGHEKKSALKHYFVPALMEFVAYIAISFMTIVPLVVIENIRQAVGVSVAITLVILCLAGYWRAYMLRTNRRRDTMEAFLIGTGIIAVGYVSGYTIYSLG